MKSNAGSIVHHFSKWVLLISLITAALLSVGGRILVSQLEYFKSEIEQELADYGITGVSLDAIQGSWQGLHPLLKINGASLSIPGRSQALSINELELSVKLLPSLFDADLKLESFHTTIEKLILVRDTEGLWWLNDIPLSPQTADTESQLDIHAFFQRLPDFVSIDIGLLQIRDLQNDTEHLIQNSSLHSNRKNQFLSLELLAQLPVSLGGQFKLNLIGDSEQQQLYVNTRDLNLVNLMRLAGDFNLPVSQAKMSIQSWLDLEQFNITSGINKVSLTQLRLKEDQDNSQSLRFSLLQKLSQTQDDWRVDTVIDKIFYGSSELSEIKSQVLINKKELKPQLWIDKIQLGELSGILVDTLDDESLSQILTGIQTEGHIEDLVAVLDMEHFKYSTVGLNFTDLQSQAHDSFPGFKKLNGRLNSFQGNSHLQLESSKLSLDFGPLFRDPLELDAFTASVNVTGTDHGAIIDISSINLSSDDLNAQGRVWLEAEKGKTPFMSLRAKYWDGNAQATAKYLPVSIMPESTVQWLDQAIRGGQVTEGGLLFHGRLQKFSVLEENQSGEFHALFDLKNPQVKFLPNWPEASQGSGQASFHNSEMNLSFSSVQFASSTVEQVDVSIPNLMRAELLVNTDTTTNANELLGTLSSLPILDLFETVKSEAQHVSGEIKSQLNLSIPLSSKIEQEITVKATADIKTLDLSIPEWMLDFKNLNGSVAIENEKVTAEKLTGLYYGNPSQLTIKPDSKDNRTEFKLTGDLDSHQLFSRMPAYLKNPVKGVSPWELNVSVANRPSAENPLLKIQTLSKLKGTEFNFPQPAGVTKDEQLAYRFNALLTEDNILNFDVELKDRFKSAGRLKLNNKTDNDLLFLGVYFEQGKKVKTDNLADDSHQEENGIYLSGNIDQLNINQWGSFLDSYFNSEVNSSSFLEKIQNLDLSINQLTWGSQQAYDSKLNVKNNGFFLIGNIVSSLAAGDFKLPFNTRPDNPFTADLSYIQLKKTDVKHGLEPSIEDMPNLHINSKVASFNDMVFSNLILKTQSEKNQFKVNQLDFSHEKVQLRSSGHWQYNTQNDDHVSVFNIDIKGENFGQTVSSLGLGETIKNGDIDFNGQIGWAGSLYDINWPTLIGEVQLNLLDGYLKNVDPGAGRFVGLLSLNALPKRLFLDFGDVVLEGMQFDKIKGRFKINGEIMKTTNASMDGSSAKVKIKGTTNLKDQTYDQSMIIIPKVGDTLPVIGSLAAGNAVGWGLLLLQKLFKKPIEKSVEIEYKVSGSWKDPVITHIPKPEPENTLEIDLGNENS